MSVSRSVTDQVSLLLESLPCPYCQSVASQPILAASDRLKRVPGTFTVVKCHDCQFVYLNPRVSPRQLLDRAPEGFGPSLNRPAQRSAFHGGRLLSSATRWGLARHLGYHHLSQEAPDPLVRVLGRLRARRLAVKFPPFLGQGRLLDVGCWTGAFLERMAEVGWSVTGIELLPGAAMLAREATQDLFPGDMMDAPFPEGSFDLVTAFHILEHVSDPLKALQRILRWLAPGGLALVEVPNFNGLGRRLFGKNWYGLDLPFHISHFTPRPLMLLIERAGGRVIQLRHLSDSHYVAKSLECQVADVGRRRIAAKALGPLLHLPVAKRLLALGLGLACRVGFGEAIRATIVSPRARQHGV